MTVIGILITSFLLLVICSQQLSINALKAELKRVTSSFEEHLVISEDIRDYEEDFYDYEEPEIEDIEEPINNKIELYRQERLQKNPHRELEIEIENSCENWGTY